MVLKGTGNKTLVLGTLLQTKMQQGAIVIDYQENTGMVIGEDGRIENIQANYDKSSFLGTIVDYGKCFLVPGFIDTHVHFPQIDLMGAYSGALIEWLDQHTFPHEINILNDDTLAKSSAVRFCNELYGNGTTTAVAFACSKEKATDLMFDAFAKTGGRVISGKISMDQNAPQEMLDSIDQDMASTLLLIDKWHGFDDRIFYALSPRFVPSCSKGLLKNLGTLFADNPDLYLQTHYAENLDEIAWVHDHYPKSRDYLDVYDSFGLLNQRTILAHGIHSSPTEKRILAEKKVIVSHCPTSNLFLGSGLFSWKENQTYGVPLTLGTDVGAGTSFSLWQTMGEAIKISKIRNQQVLPEELMFSASQGAADALGLGQIIGTLEPGKDADFQVIDSTKRDLLHRRLERVEEPRQILSALMFLANETTQAATWVRGKKIWQKKN